MNTNQTPAALRGEAEAVQMSTQLALDLSPLVTPDYAPDATIQERFEAFHEANPAVLSSLEALTRQYLASGRDRLAIGALFERLRWEHDLHTTGDPFRLNNSFRSRYVRLMVERNPEWADVFATRELRAA